MTSKEQGNPLVSVQQNGHEPLISFPEQTKGRSRGILISCAVLTVAMAVVTCVFTIGFDLTTVDSATLSDDEKSELLGKYNKNSDAVVAAVNVLLALFFLSVWIKTMRNPNQSMRASWVLGMGALNVRFETPTSEKTIQSNDLMDSSRTGTFAFAPSSTTNTTNVAGNPSNDTILRSAIRLQSPNTSTACTMDGYQWPDTTSRDESYSFSVGADYAEEKISATAFPGGDLNKTAELFAYGLWTMWLYFGDGALGNTDLYTELTNISQGLQTSDGAGFIGSIQALLEEVTAPLEEFKGESSGDLPAWINFSVPEITIEFANFQLSPLVKFESVTFDLPIAESVMKAFLEPPNATDYYWTPLPADYCSDYACVFDSSVLHTAIRDQIRLLPLCMTGTGSTQENMSAFVSYQTKDPGCQFVSNTSALVFSIAHHISADEVNYTMPAYSPHRSPTAIIELKNPRKTYSVTIGRLSWETTDLAEHYGADCASGSNCNGIYFPLSNGNKHLLLGESLVPRPNQPRYTHVTSGWDVLAIQTFLQQDIIYPPSYNFAADSEEWTQLSGGNCSFNLASYVNSVVQNHFYSKDSVQPAYTAAVFWLFQNAALRDVVSIDGGSRLSLESESKERKLSSHAAIPLTSAIITCVGVVLVLVFGLFSMSSLGKQPTLTANSEV